MRKYFAIASAICIILAAGCARKPIIETPFALDGSKADAVVTMAAGYHVNDNGITTINWNKADEDASALCQNWGYTRAQAFGSQTTTCTESGRGLFVNGVVPGSCARYQVSRKYQCLN
jgi:hypothetical protein